MFGKHLIQNIERKIWLLKWILSVKIMFNCILKFWNLKIMFLTTYKLYVINCWGRGEALVTTKQSGGTQSWRAVLIPSLLSFLAAKARTGGCSQGPRASLGSRQQSPVAQASSWSELGPADRIPCLWLVNTGHVTWILASDWPRQLSESGHCLFSSCRRSKT